MHRMGNLSARYQSETKQNVLVGNQSSTYMEFLLKRKDWTDDTVSIDDKRGFFSTLVNSTSSHVQELYHRSKEFVLHRTLFLIIAGICGECPS